MPHIVRNRQWLIYQEVYRVNEKNICNDDDENEEGGQIFCLWRFFLWLCCLLSINRSVVPRNAGKTTVVQLCFVVVNSGIFVVCICGWHYGFGRRQSLSSALWLIWSAPSNSPPAATSSCVFVVDATSFQKFIHWNTAKKEYCLRLVVTAQKESSLTGLSRWHHHEELHFPFIFPTCCQSTGLFRCSICDGKFCLNLSSSISKLFITDWLKKKIMFKEGSFLAAWVLFQNYIERNVRINLSRRDFAERSQTRKLEK